MLEKTSYINAWNSFSKALFLSENLKKEKSLVIVEDDKTLESYKKIFSFLNFDCRVVENYGVLNDLVFSNKWFFITSINNLESIDIVSIEQLKHFSFEFEVSKKYCLSEITKKLIELNYHFSEFEEPASFIKKWDTLKIISPDNKNKYEISFWWDEVDDIRNNGEKTEKINIWNNKKIESKDVLKEESFWDLKNFFGIIPKDCFFVLDNLNFSRHYDSLTKNIENLSFFDYIWNKDFFVKDLEIVIPKIKNISELKNSLCKKNSKFYTKNIKTIKNFLEYNNIKNSQIFETGWFFLKSFETKKEIIICDDIIREIFIKKRSKRISTDLDLLLKIKTWDYVVHIEHWIGIFKNIVKKSVFSKESKETIKEYIEIEYLWEDRLFVPISEVSRVNKYIWVENPKLTSLSWNSWEKKLKAVKKQAEEIAEELVEIYAKRVKREGFSFVENKDLEDKFRGSFPFLHTQDQIQAIKEILDDMSKPTPTDRLLIWDVWFGKTEVVFNAIYRSFINKKQSILIVPLVVLAYEHYQKAKERFKGFGLNISVITRLENEKSIKETMSLLEKWEIHLIIWTHKLLTDKIKYKNLWLIITDEEHKFWVSDKEKVKKFKVNIDSIAMSATPIPRSLNMALSNIRQISILKTAPHGRQDIETIISRFSENIINTAWKREFDRKGQMFFVHNRVWNIENIKTILKSVFPNKKIIVAHGKLAWTDLEKAVIDFKNKKYDILLSTTVIENWIDFPNVNTIIINNAESFWLSQIHQLRWRVWRSEKKGYCFLLYKWENLKTNTAQRLKTIAEYSYLWAGFELAMKDLEIRWWWDLLGFRQSWQANQVGINLYLKIIEEKVAELSSLISKSSDEEKNSSTDSLDLSIDTKIDLDMDLYIPDDVFDSELDKINFYREAEMIFDLDDLENMKMDFSDKSLVWLKNLFDLIELKIRASKYMIWSIKKIWLNYQIDFDYNSLEKSENVDEVKILKDFLEMDKEVKFKVITVGRVRSNTKNFANNKSFIEYMLSLFGWKIRNEKVKKVS